MSYFRPAALRSAAFMRVCQPAPSLTKKSTTSWSIRRCTERFVLGSGGRPARRRSLFPATSSHSGVSGSDNAARVTSLSSSSVMRSRAARVRRFASARSSVVSGLLRKAAIARGSLGSPGTVAILGLEAVGIAFAFFDGRFSERDHPDDIRPGLGKYHRQEIDTCEPDGQPAVLAIVGVLVSLDLCTTEIERFGKTKIDTMLGLVGPCLVLIPLKLHSSPAPALIVYTKMYGSPRVFVATLIAPSTGTG